MSNDAEPIRLTKTGTITIDRDGIRVEGFTISNGTCRDLSILACLWAIGELQREAKRDIEKPGGSGRCSVD